MSGIVHLLHSSASQSISPCIEINHVLRDCDKCLYYLFMLLNCSWDSTQVSGNQLLTKKHIYIMSTSTEPLL